MSRSIIYYDNKYISVYKNGKIYSEKIFFEDNKSEDNQTLFNYSYKKLYKKLKLYLDVVYILSDEIDYKEDITDNAEKYKESFYDDKIFMYEDVLKKINLSDNLNLLYSYDKKSDYKLNILFSKFYIYKRIVHPLSVLEYNNYENSIVILDKYRYIMRNNTIQKKRNFKEILNFDMYDRSQFLNKINYENIYKNSIFYILNKNSLENLEIDNPCYLENIFLKKYKNLYINDKYKKMNIAMNITIIILLILLVVNYI